VRRILVHRRMSVNAVTRGFTAPRNDQLFLLEFHRRISSSLKAIRGIVLALVGAQATPRAQSVPDVLSANKK